VFEIALKKLKIAGASTFALIRDSRSSADAVETPARCRHPDLALLGAELVAQPRGGEE
jgi:hypothetical protein